MSNRKYGIAVIGAGDRGTAYTRVWAHLDNARLVSLCDLIPERRDRLQSEFGFEVVTDDYKEAILREDIDIVTVCVPAALHPEVSMFALESGKHVLSEKPLALSLKDGMEVTRAAERLGLKYGLGFQYRHMPKFQKIKKAVDDGMVGRPTLVRFADIRQIRSHKLAMHDLENGNGGPIIDMCCHLFDLMRWYFNSDPVKVMARALTFGQNKAELASVAIKAPDTSAITVEFASGDIGSITLCWGLPSGVNGNLEHSILGPEGMLVLEKDGIVSVIQKGGVRKEIVVQERQESRRDGEFDPATMGVVTDFLAAIEENRAPRTGGRDGEFALAASLAVLKSADLGRAVEIEEIMRDQPKAVDFA